MARTLRSGHTLLEVLLAMGVGALLLTAVLAAFLSASRLLSWIGTRTDVASSALLGLNSLARDVRSSAYETLTITDTPPALAFLQEDPTTNKLNGFLPANVFTIYYYQAATHAFVRKTWNGTQPSNLLPDPFGASRLTAPQLVTVLGQTNGTEHNVASNVVAVTCSPSAYPTTDMVAGVEVTLVVSAVAPNGQTCEQKVTTLVHPRNHP